MAFDSPAFCMDSTTQDAALFRRAIGTLINPAGGIVSPGDLAVTQQATPNMSVAIGTGEVWIPGTSLTTQGPYYSANHASITQPITTASASAPRIDTITAQIIDANFAGPVNTYTCAPGYVMGTPTAGATLANLSGKGTVPASSLVLAYVLVPQSATSITTADIANVAALFNGWTPYTPAFSTGGSAFAVGNATLTGRYKLSGSTCQVRVSLAIPSGWTGSGGTNNIFVSVPFGINPSSGHVGQQVLTCEISVTQDGFNGNWLGCAPIGAGTGNNLAVPSFPQAPNNASLGPFVNSYAGSGYLQCPAVATSGYPLQSGNSFNMWGSYETA